MSGALVAKADDVLLNSTGTGTIGRSSVFPGMEGFVVDGHVTVLRPRRETTEGRWLNAVLRTPWGQTFLETECYSGSTNQVELSRTRLANAMVPLPPLPEQRQIAEVLDTVDEAVRRTEQIIAKLKQVKHGLLHDLLTQGIDDNGELRDPDRHPEQFKDSPLGRIPKGWEVLPLGELSNVVRGSTPRPAKDPRYFGGTHTPWITVGELSRDDWPYLTSTATRLTELGARFSRHLHAGTVVLSNSGYGCGVPKILQLSGCANDGIAAFLDLSDGVVPLFLYYFLFSQILNLRTRVARGVDQPNLNTDLLRAFRIPMPPRAEQEAVSNVLFGIAERERREETEASKLRLLKSGLMEDLLTGRVRVTPLLEEAAE
ncbi:MAG: restriction endonuclease subunit S [Myxococcales bacterium]|nr:restriction endonuclease subunit S [Myxococcales bacterium]MCB9576018.1 restriction endonuclease subunit S [Polyangiaceae bacterium]